MQLSSCWLLLPFSGSVSATAVERNAADVPIRVVNKDAMNVAIATNRNVKDRVPVRPRRPHRLRLHRIAIRTVKRNRFVNPSRLANRNASPVVVNRVMTKNGLVYRAT